MTPIRFSHLKAFARSPLHARFALAGGEIKQTRAMEKGTALHAMLFKTRKVVAYAGKRDERVKAWQDFKALHAHAQIETEDGFLKALGMEAAVRANERARQLLCGPGVVNEATIIEKIAGRECRATPDARGPEGIADLKSTGNCSPRDFWFHVRKMGYHAQLAWYARVAAAAEVPFGPGRFVVAIESAPPHLVQVYRLPADLVEEGDRLATLWFEGLRVCEQSNTWPGYGPAEMELEAPYQDDGLDWGASDDEAAA